MGPRAVTLAGVVVALSLGAAPSCASNDEEAQSNGALADGGGTKSDAGSHPSNADASETEPPPPSPTAEAGPPAGPRCSGLPSDGEWEMWPQCPPIHPYAASIHDPSDPGCPQALPGPRLVEVPGPASDGGTTEPDASEAGSVEAGRSTTATPATYCIDATEVTYGQYARFLLSEPSAAEQPAECGWNDSFVPADGWPVPVTVSCDAPVTYVDWCDARAFCDWAGKRLCGGFGGEALLYTTWNDRYQSEWYNVCTGGGAVEKGVEGNPFSPCGNYTDVNCLDDLDENTAGAYVLPVGAKVHCHPPGAFADVYDLAGNVDEWVNECEQYQGREDTCLGRGSDVDSLLSCEASLATRETTDRLLGFRCCADAL